MSGVRDYFAGKTLFVTGATGFMGKCLVEKALRSCSKVKKIYVLVRPRKGVTAQERWDAATDVPLFEKLKAKDPNALKKVVAVPGDTTVDGLGLSHEFRELLKNEINIIYNFAASVQFNDGLIDSLTNNTKSTYMLCELAKEMKKFECFIQISTGYCNCEKSEKPEEKVYKAHVDWRDVLHTLKHEPELLSSFHQKILANHPTTYTFSKALAENVVYDYSDYFPVVIMRPAIVINSYSDPIRGWVDNCNSAHGIAYYGIRQGFVRTSPLEPSAKLCWICVDHSVAACLAAAWEANTRKATNKGGEGNVHVIHENYPVAATLDSRDVAKWTLRHIEKYPSPTGIWYPFLLTIPKFIFPVLFILLQVIPALVFDFLALLTNQPRRAIKLTKIFAKSIYGPIGYFMLHDFDFPNENLMKLCKSIPPEEKEEFPMEAPEMMADGKMMVKLFAEGILRYFFKEDLSPEAIEKNRKRVQKFKILHYAVTSVVVLFWTFILYKFFV